MWKCIYISKMILTSCISWEGALPTVPGNSMHNQGRGSYLSKMIVLQIWSRIWILNLQLVCTWAPHILITSERWWCSQETGKPRLREVREVAQSHTNTALVNSSPGLFATTWKKRVEKNYYKLIFKMSFYRLNFPKRTYFLRSMHSISILDCLLSLFY